MLSFTTGRRILKEYFVASSIEEALAYLSAHHGEAQLLGGGTHLLPQIQRGEGVAQRLVDVSHIHPMTKISLQDDYLLIGGAVTLEDLLEEELVRQQAPLLLEAVQDMGSPSLRHLATVAGDIVSAEGLSRLSVALVTLEAEAEITNLTGAQWLRLERLFVRKGLSRVDSTAEILTAIRLHPWGAGQGMALEGGQRTRGQAGGTVLLGIALTLDATGEQLAGLVITLSSAETIPQRLGQVEEALEGRTTSEALHELPRLVRQVAQELAIPPQEAASLALRAFRRALEMARKRPLPSQGSR